MSGLLLDEPLLCYQPALVRRLGLAEAAIVQQLQYWTKHSTNSHDGHLWVYKTYDAWSDEIGISAKAVRGALKRLRDDGVVVATQSPLDARDRTLWWRIDRSVIEGPSAPQGRPEDHPADTPGGRAGNAPQGISHAGDRCSTETTTENTKEGSAPASEKKIALPDGFPDELKPHLRAAYRVLRDLAERHAAKEVNVCGLAHIVMANHRKPLVQSAHECAAHFEGKAPKDVVACYRNWLRRVDALAVVEPLDDEGRTTQIAKAGGLRRAPNADMQAKQDALVAQHARFVARAAKDDQRRLTA